MSLTKRTRAFSTDLPRIKDDTDFSKPTSSRNSNVCILIRTGQSFVSSFTTRNHYTITKVGLILTR